MIRNGLASLLRVSLRVPTVDTTDTVRSMTALPRPALSPPPSEWVSTEGRYTSWSARRPAAASKWDDGGIGVTQWFNTYTGATYWLAPDGGWKKGGDFHLFFVSDLSNPALVPVELLWWSPAPHIVAGDPEEWTIVQTLTKGSVEERLGIRLVRPPEVS